MTSTAWLMGSDPYSLGSATVEIIRGMTKKMLLKSGARRAKISEANGKDLASAWPGPRRSVSKGLGVPWELWFVVFSKH